MLTPSPRLRPLKRTPTKQSQPAQFVVERRSGARAGVEGVEVELLVGRVHAVVGETEADQESVEAKFALQGSDYRDRAALAHEDGTFAEAAFHGAGGHLDGPGGDRYDDPGRAAVGFEGDRAAFGAALG